MHDCFGEAGWPSACHAIVGCSLQERSSRDYSRQLSEDASGGQAIKVEAMSQEEGSGNSSSDDNVPLRLSARPSGQHPLIKTEMDGTGKVV